MNATTLEGAVALAAACEATGFAAPSHAQAVIDAADPDEVKAMRAEIKKRARRKPKAQPSDDGQADAAAGDQAVAETEITETEPAATAAGEP